MRVDTGRGPNEYLEWSTDFDQQVAGIANNGVMPGPLGLLASVGTGAAVGSTTSLATDPGVFRLQRGTTAASDATLSLAVVNFPLILDTDQYVKCSIRAGNISSLSDGTNTYRIQFGLGNAITAGSTEGVFWDYTHSTDTHWLATTRSASTSTATPGPTVAISTFYRFDQTKYAGENTWHFWADGTEVGTGQSTNNPNGSGLTPFVTIDGSAGASNRTFDIGSFRCQVSWPKRRAA
jgi:hypothetical protein